MIECMRCCDLGYVLVVSPDGTQSTDVCPGMDCYAAVRWMMSESSRDMVNHPSHYGGVDNPYEHVKVAEAWGLDEHAHLYNCTKYIARAGKKGDRLQDLEKAQWYLNREVDRERATRQVHGSVSRARVVELLALGYSVVTHDGLWLARQEARGIRSLTWLWRSQLYKTCGEGWEACDRHARQEGLGEGLGKAPEGAEAPAATTVAGAADDLSTVLEAVYTPRSSVTSWRDHAKTYIGAMLRLIGLHPTEVTWTQAPPNTKGATIQVTIWGYITPPRG